MTRPSVKNISSTDRGHRHAIYKTTTIASKRMGTELKSPLFFYKYLFIIFLEHGKWGPKNPFGLKLRP